MEFEILILNIKTMTEEEVNLLESPDNVMFKQTVLFTKFTNHGWTLEHWNNLYKGCLRVKIRFFSVLLLIYNESKGDYHAESPYTGAWGICQWMPEYPPNDLDFEVFKTTSTLDDQINFAIARLSILGEKSYRHIGMCGLYNFYPVSFSHMQDINWVLGSEKSVSWQTKIAKQNKGFDLDKKGYITIKDVLLFKEQKYIESGLSNIVSSGVLSDLTSSNLSIVNSQERIKSYTNQVNGVSLGISGFWGSW